MPRAHSLDLRERLIVGTEEEFHIAGGSIDTLEALRAVRLVSKATLVCKRGPMGAAAFSGEIPDSLGQGESGPGFPIEVFNVLGAGDGFMSGLLRGWLTNQDWPTALTWANACGALAVSRHGCTPAYPTFDELAFFLKRGVQVPAPRTDQALEQVHWATNRKGDWSEMRIFAFDHRAQFETMGGEPLQQIGDDLPTWRGQNEQTMAHTAIAYAKAAITWSTAMAASIACRARAAGRSSTISTPPPMSKPSPRSTSWHTPPRWAPMPRRSWTSPISRPRSKLPAFGPCRA